MINEKESGMFKTSRSPFVYSTGFAEDLWYNENGFLLRQKQIYNVKERALCEIKNV